DVQVDLRAAVAEGGGEALKARARVGPLREVGGGPLQLGQAETLTVLHHHLEAAGLSQAPDRRRDHDEGERLLDAVQLTVQPGYDLLLGQGAASLLPALVH